MPTGQALKDVAREQVCINGELLEAGDTDRVQGVLSSKVVLCCVVWCPLPPPCLDNNNNNNSKPP